MMPMSWFWRKGDVALLRLVGQQRVKWNPARGEVLAHFLAELFQNLFAVAIFLHQRQAAADAAVHADRLAKDGQIQALDQDNDPDKNQNIDQRSG